MRSKGKMLAKYAVPILWIIIAVYGILCFYLYYMQSIQPLEYNNRYFQSDLPYHISMIVDDGWYYSFTAYAYQLLHLLGGGGTVWIAAFLAVVTVLCVVLTERLLRLLLNRERADVLTLSAAVVLNLVMPFFWEYAGAYRYVSYQSGNLWHNSTYQCMKLAALAAVLCYEKLESVYREKLTVRQWLIMAGLLFVCTGIKPSFLTVFAPVLAVKLLVDLVKKVPFKQIFLLGSTVLPACAVILWQNMVLFGADTGNGMTFEPWYTFSLHANKTKLAVLCSIAFPVVVLLFSLKELRKDKRYLFVWGMTAVGFLEALCLVETGTRSRDGNFLWGYCFAIFLVMIYSFVKWLSFLQKKEHVVFYRIVFGIAGVVLTYQLFCGGYFFVRLLQGETYFMLG
ncbi:MAG: hypothetical protein E7291_03600 [Lachnospiraceae bacterium]|nr:hypothetical protein [Lachnospiraceae bacterium]